MLLLLSRKSCKNAHRLGVSFQKRSKTDTQVQEARIQMETDGTNSIRKWNGKDRKITPSGVKSSSYLNKSNP